MRNSNYYKNKKITVVGLARSGLACANLLYDLGADVNVSDNQDNDITHSNALKLKLKEINPAPACRYGIKVELGRHTKGFIKDKDLAIISPGITNDALPVIWANEFKIPIISEIELAWHLCSGKLIAVTGTNGKTTVTTLIGKLLEAAGKKVFILGNIGNPFSGEVGKIEENDYISLEASSFQLEYIREFKPKISVILNFTCNHLDRYKNMQEYLEAKKRIFMNQDKTDYLVLNYEDSLLRRLAKETNAQVVYFSQTNEFNPNQAAVCAIGSILGIDKNLVLSVFKEFKGIEHRLEFVAQINNIKFINDSKATTVDSAIWALKNIDTPVVLIAGGRDKGVDYRIILDLARKKVRNAILIGEAKEKIESVFTGVIPIEKAVTLEEAVYRAYLKAKSGDNVLLSPMCSSFDMFADYEERGHCFKRAVCDLNEAITYGARK